MLKFWSTAIAIITMATPVQVLAAQTLYRCIDRQAAVSYQAKPCAPGQRLDRIIAYQPDPPTPTSGALFSRKRTESTRGSSVRTTRRTPRHLTASDRCRKAKQQREAALERLGLKRTYDQLSRLDAKVRAICKGY